MLLKFLKPLRQSYSLFHEAKVKAVWYPAGLPRLFEEIPFLSALLGAREAWNEPQDMCHLLCTCVSFSCHSEQASHEFPLTSALLRHSKQLVPRSHKISAFETFIFFFEIGSHYAIQAGPQLGILLPPTS
jgi:hypothetical protein